MTVRRRPWRRRHWWWVAPAAVLLTLVVTPTAAFAVVVRHRYARDEPGYLAAVRHGTARAPGVRTDDATLLAQGELACAWLRDQPRDFVGAGPTLASRADDYAYAGRFQAPWWPDRGSTPGWDGTFARERVADAAFRSLCPWTGRLHHASGQPGD